MTTVRPLAAGVWRLPTGKGDRENAFLIEGDDGLTLVDVGWAAAPARIASALADLGRSVSDIKRIVITHAHPDHVRGLAAFRAQVRGANVLIHEADAAWLQAGRVPVGGRSGGVGRILDTLPILHWTPVEPDGHLVDGAVIDGSDGLRVVHTPGHSPGHIVLVHEPTRALIAGDALLNRGPSPRNGPDALAWDPHLRDVSVARIPLEVAVVGVAHGSPLTSPAELDAYRQWRTATSPASAGGTP